MSLPASRRGFLRDLVGLPFLGGGLTLIGAPSAVAAPVTPGMLATYSEWLEYERRMLMYSCGLGASRFIPCGTAAEGFHFPSGWNTAQSRRAVQQRAPLVLAAVGCPLTSAGAESYWGETFPVCSMGALS